ncbi:hypothetical protein ACJ5M9_002773 [Vibrio campbellii]
MNKNAEIRAKSESMTKWTKRLEQEFCVTADGGTPTLRMESVIEKIKQEMGTDSVKSETLNELIASAFDIGVQQGFKRALDRVENGKITVRKIREQERWQLYCDSPTYQITQRLPSFGGSEIKETVFIKLTEHGFQQ